MVCGGGELAFVQQMIRESQVLGRRIHWYTSMLGKKTTLKQLRKELHGLGATALRTTELVQVGIETGLFMYFIEPQHKGFSAQLQIAVDCTVVTACNSCWFETSHAHTCNHGGA